MNKKSRFQQLNRHLLNSIMIWLPVFKFYKFKNFLLNNSGIQTRKDTKVNGHTQFYGDGLIEIGEKTWIGPVCRFYTHPLALIKIGANCDIAPEVSFVTGSHEIGESTRRAGKGIAKGIIIEDGCWIGSRVTILGGVHIGTGSVIGAGALVSENIPKNSIAVGIPARIIKKLPE